MAPKKKGKKGGKAKKEDAPAVVESEYATMDLEMLREVTPMLKQQLEKTQMDRSYVQLERDTIQNFYEITKRESNEIELAIKMKDREMENMEENHRTEVRVYVQKVKHLEYEHKNNVKLIGVDQQSRTATETTQHDTRESDLKGTKTALRLELKERELSNEDEIDQMKQAHDKNISKLRQEFQKNMDGLHERCSIGVDELQEDLELRRRVDIHEVEERKNLHVNDLMKNHEKAFTQIKNYYNDITQDNLKLIKSLKDEISQMRKKSTANAKLMHDISQENKRLSEPLTAAIQEVERLKHELKDEKKDKLSLKNAKSRLGLIGKQVQELKITHKALGDDFKNTEAERNELYDTFEHTIQTVKCKSDYKNINLEQKITQMNNKYTVKQAQLDEILQAANLDPTEITRVTNNLDEVLSSKNKAIRDMHYQVARASKAYNDSLLTFQAKLNEVGIPEDDLKEMGFKPLMTATSIGPAGLVAK